jgi:membrane protease YdiL (CAAX protease family)
MNNTTATSKTTKNITAFFVLTFIISLPFYILAFLVPQEMASLVSLTLPLAPLTAALILAYRENGAGGAKELLKRSFDYKRITRKIWYVPILFIPAVIFILAFGVLISIGQPIPDTIFPVVATPVVFLLFFFMALSEEEGWMGYAFDPMQDRWNAFNAGLLLGIIHASWHIPFFVATDSYPIFIAGQWIFLIGMRVIQAWIYNNTGKSVFGQILFHTMYNVIIFSVIPLYASPLGPALASIFVIITAVIVTFLWGPETLAKFREVCHRGNRHNRSNSSPPSRDDHQDVGQ